MSMRQISCSSWVELPDAEIAWLASLPDTAHEMERRTWCELEAGHAESHVGLGQDSFDGVKSTSWWVRWTGAGEHDIVAADPCRAVPKDASSSYDDPDDATEPCLLPIDHAGRHSFHFLD